MISILSQLAPLFTTASLAWAGLAAVAVPIVIHLLTRFRRRPQAWGAMRFLLEAYRKHRTRLQLEQWLLLTLRCLILAVLGVALAGPMLSGCSSGPLGALAGAGRIVHLVIDDSLTTQANITEDQARFDTLRASALAIIEGLRPADRLAIWRASRPSESLLSPASLDRAAARRVMENLQPRFSRADLPAALLDVNKALRDPDTRAADAEQVFVIVLSDFSRSTIALDRPAPAELALLRDRAQLFLAQPMAGRGNVQIQSLNPRRHMVLVANTETHSAAVPVELRLRRFGDEAGDRLTTVAFTLLGPDGQPSGAVERQLRWSAGQDIASVNVDLPLAELSLAAPLSADGADAASHALAVDARIQHAGDDQADVLAADNRAWSIVEVRQRLAIGVIDSPGDGASFNGGIEARQWLALALAPLQNGNPGAGRVELVDLSPAAINNDRLKTLDAVMVLRPDLLADPGWSALVQFTQRGGLVWFFVPTQPQSSSGVWGAKLSERFNLNWRIGIEPLEAGRPRGGPLEPASNGANRTDGAFWTLLTEGELSAVPEPLRLLAADWSALTKPIRIMRRVDLVVQSGEGAAENVWLRLNDVDRSPLLACATVGDGRVLMLAAALDPRWSNLPTKPLFVPLLHETLRGVLGESPQVQRLSAGRAGDRPLLGRAWDGAQRLVLTAALETMNAEAPPSVLLQRTDEGLMPVSALNHPGVWEAQPHAAARLLATNVDADAGDTRQMDPANLHTWFSAMGDVQWLDEKDPAAMLAAQPARLALAWPLLCAVMLLVLAETALARWFSHATGETQMRKTIVE